MKIMKSQNKNNQINIYNAENGETKIEVRVKDETVWLSQKQMAELFDCSADNVGLHLKNIFKDDIKANAELDKIAKEENL